MSTARKEHEPCRCRVSRTRSGPSWSFCQANGSPRSCLEPSSCPPAPPRPAVVEPLSPGRYKVQFTASAELHDKLERLAALMRAEVPDGDLAAIIEAAVTEKLERIEARRYAKTRAPRKELGGHRHLPELAPHPGRRPACRAGAGRQPLPLRRRARTTMLRAGPARVPSSTPVWHGRRPQSRQPPPPVPEPQPLPGRGRLRPGCHQTAIGQANSRTTATQRPGSIVAASVREVTVPRGHSPGSVAVPGAWHSGGGRVSARPEIRGRANVAAAGRVAAPGDGGGMDGFTQERPACTLRQAGRFCARGPSPVRLTVATHPKQTR